MILRTLLIYDAQFSASDTVAAAIAPELRKAGPVVLRPATRATRLEKGQFDLIVVGGATRLRTISPELRAVLRSAYPDALRGVSAAVFETRRKRSALLTGSAARPITGLLRDAGAYFLCPPEPFFVLYEDGPLQPGETERARHWAAWIRDHAAARVGGVAAA